MDEYVAHFVAKNGEILYETYYSFKLQQSTSIRIAETTQRSSRIELSNDHSKTFQSILKKIRYSGPINIDFKIQEEQIKIFEMNPRLGGSLMVQQNQVELIACLRTLLPALS
jgi:carbamoylphosphate synthase large subunit